MGYMEPQSHYGTWAVCDTTQGTYLVSDEIYGTLPDVGDSFDGFEIDEEGYRNACYRKLRDFLPITKREDLLSVEEQTGWAARLSAPGYLDCTDWEGVYRTEEEALAQLSEQYED